MALDNNKELDQGSENNKPHGYHVEDDNNLEEKDLKRNYLFGSSEDADANQPGMEGEGYGGHNFGKTVVTTSGDDPANPSQNAGSTNPYFKRTEPSEEHPENNNFKPGEVNEYREGTADYDGGTSSGGRDYVKGSDEANDDQHKAGQQAQTQPGKTTYNNEYGQRDDENE